MLQFHRGISRRLLAHVLVSCMLLFCAVALDLDVHSLNGTEYTPFRLSEKQLAIVRYFAQQTYINDGQGGCRWCGWWEDPNQDSNAALRYQIAAIAYTAAVAARQTPAYVEPYVNIIKNCVVRLVDARVWSYVADFEEFVAQPTFPDPVAYKNIMYSGHLAQTLALYEDLSGDRESFGIRGWNFTWANASQYPAPIPYTTTKLMDVIRQQMHEYFFGGVPCEPQSIFVICNNFPHNAFHIFDRLYATNYSAETDGTWQEAVMQYGLTGNPVIGTGQFFNLVFIMFLEFWDTLSSEGSDAWALAWMGTWWNHALGETAGGGGGDRNSNNGTLSQAFQHMLSSERWTDYYHQHDGSNTSNDLCQQSSSNRTATVGDAEGASCCQLVPNDLGNLIFPFPWDITTSFFPMIRKQSLAAINASSAEARLMCAIRTFEANAVAIDYDHDGNPDAYRYNASAAYADWATANLLLSFVMPPEDPTFLASVFAINSRPTFLLRQMSLYIAHAEYPAVHVPVAFVNDTTSSETMLCFELIRGDGSFERSDGTTVVEVAGWTVPGAAEDPPNVLVTLNGAVFYGPLHWRNTTIPQRAGAQQMQLVLDVLAPQMNHTEAQRWTISTAA